ncbi:MAG: hypothetical protein LC667_01310, partial [Thioalkalivibrio sp.]|nr:hypothetical protein [Thioalkalivibrio sp.]
DLSCLRSRLEELRVGSWATVSVPWLPDYRDRTRGTHVLAQVQRWDPLDPIGVGLGLLVAGPAGQPLLEPVLVSPPTADSDGVASVAVSSSPVDTQVTVEYAVTAADELRPDARSGAWTFAARTPAPGVVLAPAQGPGRRVWMRGRAVAPGRRPSGWVYAGSVVTAAVPRIRRARATVLDTGEVELRWEASPITADVVVEYAFHAEEDLGLVEPGDGAVEMAAAGAGELVLQGVLPVPGWMASIELTPVTAGGQPGPGRRVQAFDMRAPGPGHIRSLRIRHMGGGVVRVTVQLGPTVREWELWGAVDEPVLIPGTIVPDDAHKRAGPLSPAELSYDFTVADGYLEAYVRAYGTDGTWAWAIAQYTVDQSSGPDDAPVITGLTWSRTGAAAEQIAVGYVGTDRVELLRAGAPDPLLAVPVHVSDTNAGTYVDSIPAGEQRYWYWTRSVYEDDSRGAALSAASSRWAGPDGPQGLTGSSGEYYQYTLEWALGSAGAATEVEDNYACAGVYSPRGTTAASAVSAVHLVAKESPTEADGSEVPAAVGVRARHAVTSHGVADYSEWVDSAASVMLRPDETAYNACGGGSGGGGGGGAGT